MSDKQRCRNIFYLICPLPMCTVKMVMNRVADKAYQFSPAPWPIALLGDMTDDSAEILFQSFLLEALVSSSGMSREVHSLMLSIQHFLCWHGHNLPSKVPWKTVLERMLWHVMCLNHGSFSLLTVARRRFGGPTRKLILLRTHLSIVMKYGPTSVA